VQSSDGPRLERGPVLNYSRRITINSGIDRRVAMQPGSATDCDRRYPAPCSNRRGWLRRSNAAGTRKCDGLRVSGRLLTQSTGDRLVPRSLVVVSVSQRQKNTRSRQFPPPPHRSELAVFPTRWGFLRHWSCASLIAVHVSWSGLVGSTIVSCVTVRAQRFLASVCVRRRLGHSSIKNIRIVGESPSPPSPLSIERSEVPPTPIPVRRGCADASATLAVPIPGPP